MSKRTPKNRNNHSIENASKKMVQAFNDLNRKERRYFRRFEALALARIKWDGLPESMEPRFLEHTLLYNGRAVIYDALEGSDPENPLILGTRGTPQGPMDLYNNYNKWISLGGGGHYQEIAEGEEIVCWDSNTRTTMGWILIDVAKEIALLESTRVMNREQQRVAKHLQGREESQTDMKRLRESIEVGEPYMFTIGGVGENAINVETVDLSTPYLQHDFHEDKLSILNDFMIDLGVKTQPFDKSQYQHLAEVTMANDEIARIREDLLEPRRLAAELMNEKWGLDVKVDWANDEFEILELGPSQQTAGKTEEEGE